MKGTLCRSLIILTLIALVPFAGAAAQERALRVTATTGMVADLVRAIGGKDVEVTALMGPGIDPHLYKPTHGDLLRLRSSDAIVYNGLHLEGKLSDILSKLNAEKPVLALAESLPKEVLLLADKESATYDPHIWFDVQLWAQTIPALREFLTARLPQRSKEIENNARSVTQHLLQLHQQVATAIATVPAERRVLITAHDAFSYLGRAYGIEVHGLQGVNTAVEYGVNDISRIVDLIVARRVPAIFVETSVPQRFVNALIEGVSARGYSVKLGGELYSDALGPANSGAETYSSMVKRNVETIVKALGGSVAALEIEPTSRG